MTTRQLGTTLKRIRKSKGLSQYALAKKAGISREYVRQLEEGQSDPTVGTLRRLAEALEVSLAALVESKEQLEALASAVVAGAEGDLVLAMTGLVRELENRPGLILGSWEDLRSSGSEPRRRAADVVEVARSLVSRMAPLNALPPNDPRRRTITFLAQGLADLVEGANQKSHFQDKRRR
jgi:transcriptional regulator with XRE-family HTH domain